MRKFENLGKHLSKEEQKKIIGGDRDATICNRSCQEWRGYEYKYVVQNSTCELAQCYPGDIDYGCTCQTLIFD